MNPNWTDRTNCLRNQVESGVRQLCIKILFPSNFQEMERRRRRVCVCNFFCKKKGNKDKPETSEYITYRKWVGTRQNKKGWDSSACTFCITNIFSHSKLKLNQNLNTETNELFIKVKHNYIIFQLWLYSLSGLNGLSYCVTKGSLLPRKLNFLTCKMRIVIVPTSGVL